MRKIKQSQANSQQGFRPSLRLPTIAIQSFPIAKKHKNQANSKRGFVLATPVNHNKKTQKSSKIKPISNEVLSSPRLSPQASK
jgi:hypothetical protein